MIGRTIYSAIGRSISVHSFFGAVVRGGYLQLDDPGIRTNEFYSDYVDSYIDKDVSQIIDLKDKNRFHGFMQLIASLTGQEPVYDRVAGASGVDTKTIRSWISVLVTGDMIHHLQPFSARSTVNR
ncbi:MAG: hypothetical protein LBM39_01300 [Candidatus Methanoplasma sp.]|jgi:predicted AAA+ superfamily ATPase|nr:hypothetical protein [Candidatus Methanoplasma sp.]